MKTLLAMMLVWASALAAPVPTLAQVDIHIGIGLPPPFVFEAPPEVVVIPDTSDVYAVPDVDGDLFFWDGWWWRAWEGRWYRSHHYNEGWAYYDSVPSFYFDVDPGWRGYYREHNWYGHRWDYERIPPERLQQNWRSWQGSRHWERHGTWGVQGYQPRPQQQKQELRHQREEQYRQKPDVQQHQQRNQEQPRERQIQAPQGQEQRQPRARQPEEPQRQPRGQPAEMQKRPQQRPQPHAQPPERRPQQPEPPHAQPPERQQQPRQPPHPQAQPPERQSQPEQPRQPHTQPERQQQPQQSHPVPRGKQQQRESQHQGKPESKEGGRGN